ncbi:MAG: DUF6569 family protein [Candidatus Limnocylindria bacterium]
MPSTSTTTSTGTRGPATAVRRAIESIQPIVSMWRDGLTVIALESSQPNRQPEELTLDQAHASAAIEVTESPMQTVPTVDAITKAMPVLILDGDTIIGGAQNRIINISILLKAASTTSIPVSCLEMGRWNSGRRFDASRPVDHSMRRMVAQQVTRSVHEDRTSGEVRYAADQGAIWHEIGERQARSSTHSSTQALHDVYRSEERTLGEMLRAFPMPPGARGIAVGLHNELVGLDLFDSAETMERQWSRLVGSAASALLDRQRAIAAGAAPKPKHRGLHGDALDRMLKRATAAVGKPTVAPSVGLGHDVRFSAPKLVGTALVHYPRAIHVALFRAAV